jgi:hypothetical protein
MMCIMIMKDKERYLISRTTFQIPKTIENQREKDETMVLGEDEEVSVMEAIDEMSAFFNREKPPKILITTADHGSHRTIKFCRDLADVIPNAKYYYRCTVPHFRRCPRSIQEGP